MGRRGSLQLELITVNYAKHDLGEAVVIGRGFPDYSSHRWHVRVLERSPQAVCHQLLGQRLHELIGSGQDCLPERTRTDYLRAVDERAGRVDWGPRLAIDGPPTANGIEILEREPDRINHGVAAVT